jgi:hypothetical protein
MCLPDGWDITWSGSYETRPNRSWRQILPPVLRLLACPGICFERIPHLNTNVEFPFVLALTVKGRGLHVLQRLGVISSQDLANDFYKLPKISASSAGFENIGQ